MAEIEIVKKHRHDGDDDGNKNNDDTRGKASVKITDHHLDDHDEDESNFKKTDDDDGNKNKDDKKGKASVKITDHHLDDHDDEDEGNFKKTDGDHGSSSSKKTKEVVKTKEQMADDMLMDICLHLPPFSVVRFRSISKNSYNRISNQSFLVNHSKVHHLLVKPSTSGVLICPGIDNHPVYLILSQNREQRLVEIPPLKKKVLEIPSLEKFLDQSFSAFKERFPRSITIDSCNGLLLSREITHVQNSTITIDYKIYNPMLNQYNSIPRMDFLDSLPNLILRGRPHIVFDPSLSHSYKIIAIADVSDNKFQVYVYSSKTEKWKYIEAIDHDTQYAAHWETIVFDGVWYCARDDDLVCFDLRNDTISFLSLPQMPDEYELRDIFYFGECAGRLLLVQEYDTDHQWFPYKFSIMEMEKSVVLGQTTATWSVKSLVNINSGYDHLIDPEEEDESANKVVHPYETDEGNQALLLCIKNEKLVSYNATTKTLGQELRIPYFEDYSTAEFLPFTPTLFPLRAFKTL